MPVRELPSIDYLRQRLRYDPETGGLFWRFWAPYLDTQNAWNPRWAGRQVGSPCARTGYVMFGFDYHTLRAHRVIWAMVYAAWPEQHIDHINHDRADNRLVNLRAADHALNSKNMSLKKNNASGVCGVNWKASHRRWVAQIYAAGQKMHLGLFHDFEKAVAARRAAEVKYGFHPNHGAPRAEHDKRRLHAPSTCVTPKA